MVKKEGRNKLKIAIIISIISVLVAIISLIFSFYIGLKDVEYKESLKKIQQGTQDIQRSSVLLEENFKKIELAQQNIFDRMNSCDKVNKYALTNNLKLLSSARNSLINNDYGYITGYLNEIELNKICSSITTKDAVYREISILVIIWALLIISLIVVLTRR